MGPSARGQIIHHTTPLGVPSDDPTYLADILQSAGLVDEIAMHRNTVGTRGPNLIKIDSDSVSSIHVESVLSNGEFEIIGTDDSTTFWVRIEGDVSSVKKVTMFVMGRIITLYTTTVGTELHIISVQHCDSTTVIVANSHGASNMLDIEQPV